MFLPQTHSGHSKCWQTRKPKPDKFQNIFLLCMFCGCSPTKTMFSIQHSPFSSVVRALVLWAKGHGFKPHRRHTIDAFWLLLINWVPLVSLLKSNEKPVPGVGRNLGGPRPAVFLSTPSYTRTSQHVDSFDGSMSIGSKYCAPFTTILIARQLLMKFVCCSTVDRPAGAPLPLSLTAAVVWLMMAKVACGTQTQS